MLYYSADILKTFGPEIEELGMRPGDVGFMNTQEIQMLFATLYTLRKTNLALKAITDKLQRDSQD